MVTQRRLPKELRMDDAGNTYQRQHLSGSEFDFSDIGVDGQERSSYADDPFCQGPEYDYDEFH